MTADEPEPSTIGETTKKTINRTLVIGAAFTAAVILTPAAFARDNHEPRPSNGIQLATDIVNLVRAVLAPAPAPVIVAPPEPVVTTQTVVVPATKTATVIVTDADTAAIPNYGYILYQDEYIPYYEGWIYHHDLWHWIGSGPRPGSAEVETSTAPSPRVASAGRRQTRTSPFPPAGSASRGTAS